MKHRRHWEERGGRARKEREETSIKKIWERLWFSKKYSYFCHETITQKLKYEQKRKENH